MSYPPEAQEVKKAMTAAHADDEIIEIELGAKTNPYSRLQHGTVADLHTIYFLGGIRAERVDPNDLSSLERSQEVGVIALFRLVKVLQQQAMDQQTFRLMVLTHETQTLTGAERVRPHAAGLIGFTESLG